MGLQPTSQLSLLSGSACISVEGVGFRHGGLRPSRHMPTVWPRPLRASILHSANTPELQHAQSRHSLVLPLVVLGKGFSSSSGQWGWDVLQWVECWPLVHRTLGFTFLAV